MKSPFLLASLVAFAAVQPASAATYSSDICVYGSTSGGVTAAVEAARLGKTVVLADPGQHLGGMTSSGLGWVDYGDKKAIGGLSREFIERIVRHYPGLPPDKWKQGPGWTFEPHAAEAVFREMLTEAKAPVHFGEELADVKKEGTTITELTMANGDVFRAKMFIDATYEGDLMAKAHVSYTIHREANSQYNETLNGIHFEKPDGVGATLQIDPYLKPGDPASGLVPLVQETPPGNADEAGPDAVQAYNYRLCLTQDPANRMPIDPPADYDPKRYELVGRYLDATKAKGIKVAIGLTLPKWPGGVRLFKIDALPNGKTDVNNGGWISTDYVGYSVGYPDADAATRRKIAQATEDYMRGLFHFLATDSRVPENIRSEISTWGLSRDEFTDNHGWPFQLYVREARRMIGAYVMTEHDCLRETSLDDSVGEGSYMLDSHSFRRIVRDRMVQLEGGYGEHTVKQPYPISYRAIIPKPDECTNLLVPACCSASHVAYASIRMEPVFMVLGQSAATAAAQAIDENVPVQKVDIKKLQARLIADKQLL